ncbi:hypothetical protein N7457_009728 [Penicillium paradoxum]|uniref:uncharacterized protein n=1 Tax=Penicillium paradoxum TaxID=176176 RepID=UPI0025470BF0|nr:uncharacterized protein N7457_009728 [Penicillium paradoxum]KAJ5774832.1 hypothetical protein N7457_009728 [Penicillium paradoxum]
MTSPLDDKAGSASIALRRLEAGYLDLPMHLFVQGAPKDEIRRVPSMAWLISHGPSKTNLVFDLGIKKDVQNYPPAVYERMKRLVHADVPQDVFESLEKGGLDVQSDINTVIFSHMHYDHTGDPSKFGPGVKFVVGPGAGRFIRGPQSYPEDPNSPYDSRGFPLDGVLELPDGNDSDYWSPLGPFPAAHDWFGDGSVYLIHAPGHLSRHPNLLVHDEENGWVYLAGDTAHDCALLSGTKNAAMYPDEQTGLLKCAHEDKELAEKHMRLVKELETVISVEVILAHDSAWLAENNLRFGIESN